MNKEKLCLGKDVDDLKIEGIDAKDNESNSSSEADGTSQNDENTDWRSEKAEVVGAFGIKDTKDWRRLRLN